MRPYLLKGHERPITQVKYNREGDLLVSCAKDLSPSVWYADDGTRLGTFNGHNGTVWTCDITYDSTRLITASADSSAKLWDMHTGEELCTFQFNEPCRAVAFSVGDQLAAISSDPFMGIPSAVHLVRIAADPADQNTEDVLKFEGPKGRMSRVKFMDVNRTLLTAGEDGCLRKWDVETGKQLEEKELHDKQINDMQFSVDESHFITASGDKTAKLVDAQSMEVLKVYQGAASINAASISPLYDQVVIGGGQAASEVTTTSSRQGKFEARFFHKIYAEEIATVRGHFGPINAVSFSPDGRGFTTGGEDGYVRLSTFDESYFTSSFL